MACCEGCASGAKDCTGAKPVREFSQMQVLRQNRPVQRPPVMLAQAGVDCQTKDYDPKISKRISIL